MTTTVHTTRNNTKVIAALRAKTVANGASPQEAYEAAMKADELEKKYVTKPKAKKPEVLSEFQRMYENSLKDEQYTKETKSQTVYNVHVDIPIKNRKSIDEILKEKQQIYKEQSIQDEVKFNRISENLTTYYTILNKNKFRQFGPDGFMKGEATVHILGDGTWKCLIRETFYNGTSPPELDQFLANARSYAVL